MTSFSRSPARPRRRRAQPNYPRSLAVGAAALVAVCAGVTACGGQVEVPEGEGGAGNWNSYGGTSAVPYGGTGGTDSSGGWGSTSGTTAPPFGGSGGVGGQAVGGGGAGGAIVGGGGAGATGGTGIGGDFAGGMGDSFGGGDGA